MTTSLHSQPAVRLTRVSRLYGSFAALRDVSLVIAAGESVMLLGENGAGKSTLLRIIAGLASPSFGTLEVLGDEPGNVRDRLALMSHASLLYDELTALENLRYFAELRAPFSRGPTPEDALRGVGLDPGLSRRVSEYSQGMRQRASLARVLLSDPDLLLLDEPFANLDISSAKSMIERLQRFVATPSQTGQPRTLIFTTHQAELARPLATSTITLSGGRIAEPETPPASPVTF